MNKPAGSEVLLWSIALPGFGQLVNGKYLKGIMFIALEFLINVQAHLNEVILSSFQGDIQAAIEQANYQWLMFYPCLYFFAMWDAYRDAGGGEKPFAYLPFVFAAYFVTIGLIYSPSFKVFKVLWGPVWLPMVFCSAGIGIGNMTKLSMKKIMRQRNEKKY